MKVSEKSLHLLFVVSLWVKAVFAIAEIFAGIGMWIASRDFLLRLAIALTREELAEDPRDVIANALLHAAQHLSIGAKTFAAVYLLSHGIIKLWLVIGLLREKLWYYPVAIVVFLGFVAYQTYRYYALQHSILLLAITVLDIIVIALTWHEWRFLRERAAARSS